jgi:hypothetical protein
VAGLSGRPQLDPSLLEELRLKQPSAALIVADAAACFISRRRHPNRFAGTAA